MGILSKRINCEACDSEDTRTIVSTSAGQYKNQFLLGPVYYCCRCGHRGRSGGGVQFLKCTTISLLSGVLLLSLYGNFVGFQPPVLEPEQKISVITIDPTQDSLLLLADSIAYSTENEPASQTMYEPLTSLITLNEKVTISNLYERMAQLNTHIPLRWQPLSSNGK